MTANEQALYALMQNEGYSHGLCVTALRILGQSSQAVKDMMLVITDEHPSEQQLIARIAELCQGK